MDRLRLLRDDILQHTKPETSYLAFTGDLVNAGDDDLYPILLDEFFSHFDSTCKGVFLVPGNHDIQWSSASKSECDKFFKDATQTYLYKPGITLNLENPFRNTNSLENFQVLNELISSYKELTHFGSFDVNEDFSIACLNSTWLSYERSPPDSDRGNLRIDPPICQHFIDKMNGSKFNIFITHHPTEWLDQRIGQTIENMITANFDLALFGHTHNPSTISGVFNAGECLVIQAPAIKASPSLGNNAYSIIHVDPIHKKYEIHYRMFSETRNKFVVGEDIADQGIKYPSEADQIHWKHIKTRTKTGLLTRFENESKKIIFREWYDTNFVSKNKLNHEFIEPRVSRVKQRNSEREDSPKEKLTDAIARDVHRQYVVGPQDSGLTTAAYLVAKHIAENYSRFEALPVYINLNELKVNKATLIRQAVRTSPVQYSHSEMQTLIEGGAVYFIFDQIGLPETEKLNGVVATMDRYLSDCRSIFFTAVDGGLLKNDAVDDLAINPTNDVIFQMEEMELDEILELIEYQGLGTTPREITTILANVVTSFKYMNEPVYPSAVCLLLETLKPFPEFRPINRARLIDRYVECLLGRLEWEDVTEGTFNSSEKVNFLANLAGQCSLRGVSRITIKEWSQICTNYSADRLIELPGDLLEEFTQKGILIKQSGNITFRADYLFTYFVAKEMNLNPNVYLHITADDAFFTNYRELVFYGELEGVDNAKLLDDTKARIEQLEQEIVESYESNGISFDEEWEEMLSENPDGDDAKLNEAVNATMAQVPTNKTVKQALSTDLNRVERTRGVTRRTTVRELEARWYVAIKTYFQLVKHSSSLSGDEKLRHLSKAANSAELFIKSLAAKRGVISQRAAFFHSGILYINPMVNTDPVGARREFKFMAPASMARVLSEAMNNPLLAPAFRKLLNEESDIVKFLARHLLLEIPGDANRRAFVESLEKTDHLVLQTCSLNRLKYKYLGYSISDGSKTFYRGIIDDIAFKTSLSKRINHDQWKKHRLLVDMRNKRRKTS